MTIFYEGSGGGIEPNRLANSGAWLAGLQPVMPWVQTSVSRVS